VKEPDPYDPEISVNWGAAVRFHGAEAWSGYFGSCAIVLLFAAATGIIKLW
jgi:hypothetical protein